MHRSLIVVCTAVVLVVVAALKGQRDQYELVWSTYLGGSDDDSATAVAVDNDGNLYVAGSTGSVDFPTRSPLFTGPVSHSQPLGFVTKLNRAHALVYSTYIAGLPADLAVDRAGSAYVAGSSDGLPSVNKISSDGSSLSYSVRWCCGRATRIAVDASGNAVVGGDAFVTKIDPSGRVLFSAQFAPGGATDVAVDGVGNIYVTGTTSSANFPTTPGAFQRTPGRSSPCPIQVAQLCTDAFVTKLDPSGDIVFSTLIGGEGADEPARMALDQFGSVYLVGYTSSRNFPVTNALQPVCRTQYVPGDCGDAFVAKLNPRGSSLEYATFLGGSASDFATAIRVDATGRAFVGGWTASPDFPVRQAFQRVNAGGPVFTSVDDGATWQVRNDGLNAYVVRKLATTRAAPDSVYAATYFGAYRSTDRGQSWRGGLLNFDVLDLAIDPQTPTIAYAVANGALAPNSGGVFKTLDGGANWIPLNIGNMFPFGIDARVIAVAPSAPSTVYLGTTLFMLRSADGGSTWSRVGVGGFGVDALAVDPRDASTVYAASFDGIRRSRDGGLSWTAPLRLSSTAEIVRELLIDPSVPSTLYATGVRGVYESTDVGATWATITGIPSFPPVTLALDPSSPSVLYAGGFEILHKSTDGGASWTHRAPGSIRSITALAVHPTRSATLYAGSSVDAEGFVTIIDATGSMLDMGTYLGGIREDRVSGLALGSDGRIYVAGETLSPDFPLRAPLQSGLRGERDAFVAAISMSGDRDVRPRPLRR